jgi:hypothetical protein
MEICKGRSTETQTELIPTQTIATQANLHADLVDAAVQMEGWSSHNKEVQTEEISSRSTGTQTEEQAKDILSSKDPILLKLQEELMQAQLALERCEQETVPLQKYQELQKQFRELTITENGTFDRFRQEEEKLKKVKTKLDRVRNQIDTICSLYSDVLTCRSPATNYALFLLERYLLLKIKAVRAGKPIELKTTEDFISCCKEHGAKVQRLLCEFYLHNFILEEEVDKNPSPFVGDIQFQAFISFAVNQLKWFKAYNSFQRQEHGLDLWVRSEPTHPLQLFAKHKRLMTQEGVIQILGPIHKEIVQKGTTYFLSIQERSLTASKMRWTVSTNSVKEREPFNYGNFKAAASRLITYNNLILREGPYWLGCRFRMSHYLVSS